MARGEPSGPGTRTYQLTPYARRHANSGVVAYALGPDFIVVQFTSGDAYLYTAASAGQDHIEEMHRHAESGEGLSAYISRHTHDRYERKLHPIGRHRVAG